MEDNNTLDRIGEIDNNMDEVTYNVTSIAREYLGINFEFRTNQLEIITKIVNNVLKGEESQPTHIIQAPTGTGKSIIIILSALTLALCYKKSSYILCSDLSLWKQYEDFVTDHKEISKKVGHIKGLASYVCQQCNKDCSKAPCRLAKIPWTVLMNPEKAEEKGYECAEFCKVVNERKHALYSKVTIMTYQMYFTAAPRKKDDKRPGCFNYRDVVFCDECHNIPELLQNAYCPTIKDTNLSKFMYIYDYGKSSGDTLFKDEWLEDMNEYAVGIASSRELIKEKLYGAFNRMYDNQDESLYYDKAIEYFKTINEFNFMVEAVIQEMSERLQDNQYVSSVDYEVYDCCLWAKKHLLMVDTFLYRMTSNGDNTGVNLDSDADKKYVVTTSSSSKVQIFDSKKGKMVNKIEKSVMLQYAKEDVMCKKRLLDTTGNVVMTSATIGDFKTFEKNLGVENSIEDNLPSLFNFQYSPIYVLSRWKMSQKYKDESFPHLQSATYELCNRYKGKKGIIQTWTYDIAKKVYEEAPEELKSRLLLYNDSKEKRDLIDFHKNTTTDTILIGPTLNEGIDLPGDECRFIIMLKVPYPYLGSKLCLKKMELYDGWYANETLRTIIQGIGRGVRYQGDWCQTYILDGSFTPFYYSNKNSFPLETQRRMKFYK